MTECTHTSDWWKNMMHCVCCGASYSDEEAERIADESDRAYRNFTDKELKIIAGLETGVEDEP